MVEHRGKWADFVYPAPAYPAFACGVGSVLSADLVHWMAENAHTLKTYQVRVHTLLGLSEILVVLQLCLLLMMNCRFTVGDLTFQNETSRCTHYDPSASNFV